MSDTNNDPVAFIHEGTATERFLPLTPEQERTHKIVNDAIAACAAAKLDRGWIHGALDYHYADQQRCKRQIAGTANGSDGFVDRAALARRIAPMPNTPAALRELLAEFPNVTLNDLVMVVDIDWDWLEACEAGEFAEFDSNAH